MHLSVLPGLGGCSNFVQKAVVKDLALFAGLFADEILVLAHKKCIPDLVV